jgi:hypothetical protein
VVAPIHRRITRWIIDHLLWDARKLLLAVAGSALLTYSEWVQHHPPEIALMALIHFVFVLAAIAVIVHIAAASHGSFHCGKVQWGLKLSFSSVK